MGRTIPRQCEMCGVTFMAQVKHVNRGKARMCSPACANRWQSEHKRVGEGGKARKYLNRRLDRTKDRARGTVYRAVRSGRLQRCPCEVCGDTRVEAHHEDYNAPLAVRWLCQKHHREADLRLGLRAI